MKSTRRIALRLPDRVAPYLFLAPGLALFLIFRMFPLLSGVPYSFSSWNGIATPTYVGLRNYIQLFSSDANFRDAVINALTVLATLPIGWACR